MISSPISAASASFDYSAGQQYGYDHIVSGTLTLTRLDRQAKICSGTFNVVFALSPGDTLRITDGRFDCHMDL